MEIGELNESFKVFRNEIHKILNELKSQNENNFSNLENELKRNLAILKMN